MKNKVFQFTHTLVYGDSVALGYNDEQQGGWVNRLKVRYINEHSKDSSTIRLVKNYSRSGDLSEKTIEVMDKTLDWYTPDKTDTILIATGINDTKRTEEEDFEQNFKRFQENITKLHTKADTACDRVIFVGFTRVREADTNPLFWSQTEHYQNSVIEEFDNWLASYCDDNQATHIPVFGLMEDDDLSWDGLHPNANGHLKIYNEVINMIN